MKHLVNLKLLILTALIIPFTISCGDDGENDGSNPTNDKRISKIVEETQSTIREYSFTYDDKGRIIEMEVNANSANQATKYKRFYQYGEFLIISKAERSNSNYQSPYSESSHTYTISDGKIVLDTESYNTASRKTAFTYDSNGYLQSILQYPFADSDEHSISNLIWENGNVTTWKYLEYDFKDWEYTDMLWPKGILFDVMNSIIPNTDPILLSKGYYGNLPKNLLSRYNNNTYQYSQTNGLVTKIIRFTEPISNEGATETSVITYTWE